MCNKMCALQTILICVYVLILSVSNFSSLYAERFELWLKTFESLLLVENILILF